MHKVYEDEHTFAFLDRHPINPGHVLVIPKNHEPDFYKLENDSYIHLMQTVKKIAKMVSKKFNPKKVGLIIAGWDVAHTHVHVVPMNDYDDITSRSMIENNRANPSDKELRASLEILLD